MDKESLNPQELAVHNLLAFNLLRGGAPYLYDVFTSGALSQLTPKSYLAVLRTMGRRGADKIDDEGNGNIYLAEQHYIYGIAPYNSTKDLSTRNNGPFHEKMVGDLGITVEDLAQAHPTTIPYLLNSAGQRTISIAVKNSTPAQVKKFLGTIVPGTPSDQRGDNKCSVAGLLVFCSCQDVIKNVQEKVPDWAQTLDHRKRNALFYARTKDAFQAAISGGADPSQKDKNGRDPSTWWNLALPPAVSTELCSLLSGLGKSGVPTPRDLMVNKLMRLGFDKFDEQDREEFQKALADKDWKWSGMLEGIRHDWTLSEIWKFGELAVITSRSNPMDSSLLMEMSYSKDRRHNKSALPKFIQAARNQLPVEFRAKLMTPQTSFEYALDFLGLVAPEDFDKSTYRNDYYAKHFTHGAQERVYQDYSKKFLSSLDREEQEKLIEGLEVLRDAKWAWDHNIVNPVLGEIAGSSDPSASVVDRKLWCQYYLSLPMKHAFHAPKLQAVIDTYCQRPPLLRSSVDDPLTAQVRIKTLGGISNADSYQYAAWKSIRDLVEDGALKGVEVPSRWLKNLEGETRIVVARALLENKAATKRKDIDVPEPSQSSSRPKM